MRIADFKLDAVESVLRGPRVEYDRSATVLDRIEARVAETPDATAVACEGRTTTYAELWEKSARLAQFLTRCDAKICGVLMDDTDAMLVAILGIARAGVVYLPANPDLPLERNRFMFADAPVDVVVTEKKYIREANRLQWDCPHLRALICLDSLDVHAEREPLGELMRTDLWNYVGESATDEISAGGWGDSYTGADLPAAVMAEYAENVERKLAPLIDASTRVLEIGCSSGITMFRLAPRAGFYYGIDLSASILARTERERARRGLDHVKLEVRAAHDVDGIDEKDFDLVVINSVVQNWNGHNYVREVLRKLMPLLRDGARIFIGDVMELERRDALIASLVEFKRENAGRGYKTKTDWSNELFLSRDFFEDLRHDLPQIAHVERTEKIHTIPCELTQFRCDILLTTRVAPAAPGRRGRPRATVPTQEGRPGAAVPTQYKQQFDWRHVSAASADPLPRRPHGDDLAYILYTSGTTGRPKGVAVGHRSLHNYIAWAARHYFAGGGGNMPLFTSPSFDLTLTSIFVPLVLGRTVTAFRNDDVDKLLATIFTTPGIDAVKLTPAHISILRQLELPSTEVRTIIAGGEDLLPEQCDALRAMNPAIRIFNEYGPTEATVGCTIELVDELPITIGVPVDNTDILILDSDLAPVPDGIAGELCVAGECLALGYWNDAVLTAKKFVDRGGERIYRTGDRARRLPDGDLLLLGRIDQQVKIRGSRIELGEIEAALRNVAEVDDAVVVDKQDASGEKCLCAYVLSRAGTTPDALRQELGHVFPEFMIPQHFVFLGEFPLNANGKLDRRALPEPAEIASARGVAYAAPETQLQRDVAEVWRQVLGLERVGIDDNFFDVGGHSLKATQVVSRLHKKLGIEVALREVFRHPTVRALCAAIDGRASSAFEPIPRVAPRELYEVSHAQARLWLLQQIDRDPVAYNVQEALRIEGPLDVDALRRAFRAVIARYEILRTSFVEVDGVPRQRVHDDVDFDVRVLDGADVEAALRADAATPFDLGRAPLLRVTLLQPQQVLAVTMHHIVTDGWSSGIFVRQLLRAYRDERSVAAPRIQYRDFAAWQNAQLARTTSHRDYWHARFATLPPPLDLPSDAPRPAVRGVAGDALAFRIGARTTTLLRTLGVEHGASLFMLLLAAFDALLHRYTGQTDLVVGSPIAGRTHPDLEEQIGFFTNTLTLRTEVESGLTFLELLARVKSAALEAFEHQAYPFDRLVGELALPRDTSRTPLVSVLFALQNNERVAVELDGLTFAPVDAPANTSKFDLSLFLSEEGSELAGTIEYSTELFSRARIALVSRHFSRLLDRIAANPHTRVGDLDLLTMHDVVCGSGAKRDVEDVLASFRRHVALHPERPAVVSANGTLTYRELAARVDAFASSRDLLHLGQPVIVSAPRSEEIAIALLGTLEAGGAYLYLDPSLPRERRDFIARDARNDDPGVAYIVYTSGSTGIPKGVLGTRLCLSNLIAWQTRTIGEGVRTAFYAALGFDVAVQEVLFAAASGGTLVVPDEEERLDPRRMIAFVERHEIELLTMPFSALALLFSERIGPERMPSLRHLVTSGEQLHVGGHLRTFLQSRPDVLLHNQYGPSETHVVTSHTVGAALGNLVELPPIGVPIDNTTCRIVDERLRPVPTGVAGELLLGGVNVARGYIGAPELTASKFIDLGGERVYRSGDLCRWRPDGTIELLGRIDTQMKVRGYRVEPGEVEHALLGVDGIEQACVVLQEKELAAFLVSSRELDAHALHETLAAKLPAPLIPSRFLRVDALPKTSTGKLDRKRVATMSATPLAVSTSAAPPVTETETLLHRIEAALLGREVGIDDDFFASGGHSLAATQLVSRLRQATGIDVSLLSVFRRPTIRALAAYVDELRVYHDRHDRDCYALLARPHARKLFAMPPILGYAIAFRGLAKAIDDLAATYGFDFVEDDVLGTYAAAIRELQPAGELTLFGYSAGGSLAFELARRLAEEGRRVSDVIFFDTFRPEAKAPSDDDEVARIVADNLAYFDAYIAADAETRMFVDNADVRALLVRKMGAYVRTYERLTNEGAIDANLHLITSGEFADDARHERWRAATTGRFTIHRGAGKHTDMLFEPNLAANAAVLRRVLEESS